MNLRSRYGLSLSAISLIVCPMLVSVVTLPEVVFGSEVQELRSDLNLVAQATGDRQDEADRLLEQAIAKIQIGDYQNAIQLNLKALAICQEIKYIACESRAFMGLGIAHEILGQYQKALDFYEQSSIKEKLGYSRASQNRKAEADRLLELGIEQLKGVGDGKQLSLESFQSALDIYRSIKDRKGEASALIYLGRAYVVRFNYKKAFELYQQSLEISKQIRDPIGELDALNQLASVSKPQKAIEYLQQYLAISKQIKDRKNEAHSLFLLGYLYNLLKQNEKAIDFYQQSLDINRQIGNIKSEENSLLKLEEVYREIGQIQKATDYKQQALAIQKQISSRESEGKKIYTEGVQALNKTYYREAIDSFQKALEIFRLLGDYKIESNLLVLLGHLYIELGQYQKSLDYYQQYLTIAKGLGDKARKTYGLYALGGAYYHLGQYQKAMDSFQQALFGYEFNPTIKHDLLNNMGKVHNQLGRYKKAIDYYQQSLPYLLKKYDRRDQGISLGGLGHVYKNLGDYQKAIDFYLQSLQVAEKLGDRTSATDMLDSLGLVFSILKQPEVAIIFYKQSINIEEPISKRIQGLEKGEKTIYLKTISYKYKALADLLIKQGRVTEALQVLDLLKIQELEDYLKNVKGNNITEKGVELLAPEKAISDQLSSLSLDKIPELNQQLASKLQQLPKSEINKVPPYFQNIPQGAVLIYPFILEDRLELIIYTPNTLPINRTIPIKKEELQQLVTDFRLDLQGNGTENIKISSKKLYDLIIKPIEAELQQSNATTILYAPDGVLRYIPLAALYDGKQYLIEKYRINNLIAYSLFDQNRKTQTNPSIFAGAYGNSNQRLVSGFSQLPATIPEVDSIQTTFANTTKITEKDFTAQASKDKAVGNSIVHLATHASFRSGSPLDSYVLFGDGSKATIFDISEWNLKDVNLFVLSACQTGLGTSANGAEILGFGYQVQRAGAKASIASLWEVSDGGTQLLMQAFYSQIKQGNISTSEALRQAQIAMINSDKKVEGSDRTGIKIVGTLPNNPDGKLSHPYYWSAFVLIGNGL